MPRRNAPSVTFSLRVPSFLQRGARVYNALQDDVRSESIGNLLVFAQHRHRRTDGLSFDPSHAAHQHCQTGNRRTNHVRQSRKRVPRPSKILEQQASIQLRRLLGSWICPSPLTRPGLVENRVTYRLLYCACHDLRARSRVTMP